MNNSIEKTNLEQYNLWPSTKEDYQDFLQKKNAYLAHPSVETSVDMKSSFQILHGDLKQECSAGNISFDDMTYIVDCLRKI